MSLVDGSEIIEIETAGEGVNAKIIIRLYLRDNIVQTQYYVYLTDAKTVALHFFFNSRQIRSITAKGILRTLFLFLSP